MLLEQPRGAGPGGSDWDLAGLLKIRILWTGCRLFSPIEHQKSGVSFIKRRRHLWLSEGDLPSHPCVDFNLLVLKFVMGCAHSKPAAVAPHAPTATPAARVTSPTPTADPVAAPITPGSSPTPGTAPISSATSAAADVADRRCEAPTAFDRVLEVKDKTEYVAGAAGTFVNTAQGIISAAPRGLVDSFATGAASAAASAADYSAANAPRLAAFLGILCGTAADLLGAIAPAIPFGGVAAAVLGKALEQGAAYAQAIQAAHDLRQVIADRRSTIEMFAGEASLAQIHASLVGHAAQTLRDAVALLVQSYSGPTQLRSEVCKFFTARGRLQALLDAASGLKVGGVGSAKVPCWCALHDFLFASPPPLRS